MIKRFEDSEVWNLAKELALDIYKILKQFPENEKYVMVPQMKRAAHSAHANIAEAFGRYHFKDTIKFLYNARVSLAEVKSFVYTAKDPGYIKDDPSNALMRKLNNLSVKLNNLINASRG